MIVVYRMLALPFPLVRFALLLLHRKLKQKLALFYVRLRFHNDDTALCLAAFDRGCLEYLAALIQSLSPAEPASPVWEEDEPESISSLREVSKTKINKKQASSIHYISFNGQLSPVSHLSRSYQTSLTKNKRPSTSSPSHFMLRNM
jgi:hypothetical protein